MLHARGHELAEIDRLLVDARAGAGRALVLVGDVGIGKTALLNAARERATDIHVVGVVGLEAEADLPFAALGEVARPFLDLLPALPGPQRRALASALALTDAPQPLGDRFAIFAGFLGLLRSAAERDPLLVLVDDVQWLDSASAQCIGYAARRLHGSRVALMAANRTGAQGPSLLMQSIPALRLQALGHDDALALLERTAPDLAPAAAESLVAFAAGIPLALLELPRLLTRQQRQGLAAIDPVPVPQNGLRDALARRLAHLPADARAAVTVASASFDGALPSILHACRKLGIAVEAVERAEEEGVLTITDDHVAFAHPLLRAVAQHEAGGSQQRRAHAALAERADEDARAWHLAAAALGPDEGAAGALEAAGLRASQRAAHSAAADALERAARLSVDPRARDARLLSAGLEAALAGNYERAVALLEPAACVEDAVTRATINHLTALISLNGGIRDARTNHRKLSAEAERIAQVNPAMAASLHADAGVTAVVAGDCHLALASAERAVAALPSAAPPTIRCQVRAMRGMAHALRGRTAEAAADLDEAGRLLPQVAPLTPVAQSISFALHARICVADAGRLREEMLALVGPARVGDTLGLLPYYLLVAADAAYRLGDWPAAAREAAEAVTLADECGARGPLSIALVVSGRLRAALGEQSRARAELERAIAVAGTVGYGATTIWARAALGFLDLGLGRTDHAIAELEEAERLAASAGLEDPVIVPWAADLVEAYVRGRRTDDARRVASVLASRAQHNGAPLALALAARCEGLSGADAFDASFERAVAFHERASAPFEHARTLLAWGACLHRASRRAEARDRLRGALGTFAGLEATPWVQLTRAELRAAGARRRREWADSDELTSQELRIAQAAARGARTREIAAEMFLSPKTVEFHLGQVYRKLGVHSRVTLATVLAERGDAPPEVSATRDSGATS